MTRARTGSAVLVTTIVAVAGSLAWWKTASLSEAMAASANQPEPVEAVTAVVAAKRHYQPTTTAVGTVLSLRSITLRNELPGTVRTVRLVPGRIVDEGELLVALDVTVEKAELEAQEAQAVLAESVLQRSHRLRENNAISEEELDRARADRDVARAQMARTRAIIERKTIRAPFRARVGIADVHPGQYLNEGTQLTTLQGIDDSVHVDFSVEQELAASLREGDTVDIVASSVGGNTSSASIVAIDARVDATTRNAAIRARLDDASKDLAPGASVRVHVPVGRDQSVVAVPASALRKGPSGDHVFVLSPDEAGNARAHMRPVEVAALLGDEVVIKSGLAAGEKVAASGSFKLREAVLVALADPSLAGPAGSR